MTKMPLPPQDGEIIWQASEARKHAAHLTRFIRWLNDRGHSFEGYTDLWQWSVDQPQAFWQAIWDHFDILHDGSIAQVMTNDPMPRTRWFTGTRLNYAEHVLRHETIDPSRTMLHHASELRALSEMSWGEIGSAVRRLATTMREMGLGKGDCVTAYMPNIPETVIAMLATTAIGATWSSAAPEFGAQTVIDRFSQIKPKLIFATNGYRFGGKDFDRTEDLSRILDHLPEAQHLVMLDYHPDCARTPRFHGETLTWHYMLSGPDIPAEQFSYTRVPSDHPLWVLFSSGTTGLPKAITQGHHGILLEHYKSAAFHFEIPKGGALFFYSTTGWMVWNTLMWGPLMEGRAVLYDGHPAHPDAGLLWELTARTKTTTLGVSPTYLQIVRQQGIAPGRQFDLKHLQSVMLVGSPATPEVFQWTLDHVSPDVWPTSQSGGTEFCSGILAGSPLLPTRAGEIQAPALGIHAVALDDQGAQLTGQTGELVVKSPAPSMPLFLWGDDDFSRYHDSYFDTYPGLWRHGDRVQFTDTGGAHVLGRSDATLNRYGVRIGSAEIYRTLDKLPQIADSLIICIELPDGGYYMPLFVEMAEGETLTHALTAEIRQRLKQDRSPRHVPDEIVETPAIPMTLTGKKMEVPIRKLLLGAQLHEVASRDACRNPTALDWFVTFAEKSRKAQA